MEQKKLKVGFISNSPLIKTGLSRNVKAILPILYKTNKYDIYFLNQSMGDNDPNYQRFPWKNEGVMKNFDQNRINQDQQYARTCAYGNLAIEDWVVKNKLDVVITWDDGWAFLPEFYFKKDWYQHIKENFLIDITVDSEPILPLIKEWARECPNFHSWSGFAERLLKQEDSKLYGHIKTLRGAIDSQQFKPLSKQEKLDLRHKFGISDSEKIILYLGRNQIRKNSFHANQEALALWKQKNPDKKIRLLFHTKVNEPNGWPIDQIREELKLDKNDILVTYFCRNCQDWNVRSYENEDIDCPHCKAQKSRVTAGIDSTINEHDLNKIYNISDACCSSFTSGGQEYNLVESMLSGLPLACPDYSCGEDFILSGFVKEIKGTYYREFNTSFYKFTPDINSIVDFYEYIWNLKNEDREILVKNAREWAIKEFDAKSISKQIEEWMDTRKPIDWDSYFNRKKELKDLNAQLTQEEFNIKDDKEYIKVCYKKLLNMEVKDSDEGLLHWERFLSQPKDKGQLRNELIQSFKMAANQHNQKVQPQIPFESLLLNNGKKQFLLVCKESAGDILYASSLLKSLRNNYPSNEWNIYFACEPQFNELLDCNLYIDKILPYQQFMESEIHCTGQGDRKGDFDAYCFLTTNTQRHLSYLTHNNVGQIN